jgi:hypothetical protein
MAVTRPTRTFRDHAVHFAIIVIAGLIAICLLFIVTRQPPNWTLMTLAREVWVAILTSFGASALFALIAAFSDAFALKKQSLENEYFSEVRDVLGISSGRAHRIDYLDVYRDRIKRANRRIWAFGTTNKAFISTHHAALTQKAKGNNMDIRIAFLDPEATLTVAGAPAISLLVALERMERGTATGSIAEIRGRLDGLSLTNIKILLVSAPTQFSCLVIDDVVFFFPFTAPSVSSHQPMLEVQADHIIGKSIIEHLDTLMTSTDFCRILPPPPKNDSTLQ